MRSMRSAGGPAPGICSQGEDALVSYDEHTIPRWTHKFHISKGYVTTRNKHMRCEKLFYTYDVLTDRYLAVRATPGDTGLMEMAVPLTRQTLQYGQPKHLHALFDAGAGKSDAGVRALLNLAEEHPERLDVTLRACRYPHRMKLWKALPAEQFASHLEPGRYVGAAEKEIRLAETLTVLKGERAEQAVRTVICREMVPGPRKDRWHPLYTTSKEEPMEVLTDFRQRQHHEQAYRVGVHDEMLDGVPCGYDKESPDPNRPRWQRGGMQMIGWLAALGLQRSGEHGGGVGERLQRQPHKDDAAELFRASRDTVPDAESVDREPGPIQLVRMRWSRV